MLKMLKSKKGLTLFELLVALVILGLTVSIVVISIKGTVDDVKKESIVVYENSVLTAGSIFTNEFEKDLYWRSNDEETMACINVQELINQGFLKQDEVGYDYKDYSIKVIKSEEQVNKYQLLKTNECKIKDTKAPIITFDENPVNVEIKDDYNLMTGVTFDGTGSDIVEQSIKLDGKEISNTKELSLGQYIIIYKIKDEGDNETEAARTVNIVDTQLPIINTLLQNPNSSITNWQKNEVELTGKAIDTGSGIVAYQFSQNAEINKNSSGWKTITTTLNEISQKQKVTTNGKWYFYVKDEAGNVAKRDIQVYIDKTAPIFVSQNGSMGLNSIPVPTFQDSESGINQIKYYISTISTTPDKNNSSFTTSNSISMGCNTTYYAWAIATDKAGNISDVKSLGSYYYSCSSGSNRGSSNSSSSSSNSSSCGVICQMQKNSEAWHQTDSTAEKNALHATNTILSQFIPGSYYESSTGIWRDASGNDLYEISNSSKKTSSSSSSSSKKSSSSSSSSNKSSSSSSSSKKSSSSSSSSIAGKIASTISKTISSILGRKR